LRDDENTRVCFSNLSRVFFQTATRWIFPLVSSGRPLRLRALGKNLASRDHAPPESIRRARGRLRGSRTRERPPRGSQDNRSRTHARVRLRARTAVLLCASPADRFRARNRHGIVREQQRASFTPLAGGRARRAAHHRGRGEHHGPRHRAARRERSGDHRHGRARGRAPDAPQAGRPRHAPRAPPVPRDVRPAGVPAQLGHERRGALGRHAHDGGEEGRAHHQLGETRARGERVRPRDPTSARAPIIAPTPRAPSRSQRPATPCRYVPLGPRA